MGEKEDDDTKEVETSLEEEEKEEEKRDDAIPIGKSVKVPNKRKLKRTHFLQFEFNGNVYGLEDTVMFTPEDDNKKPYVAIIKDIMQTKDGSMMIEVQWFYRPEEAEKKDGGNWKTSDTDTRELFYSFHPGEVPAESLMHRCVVHFIPAHKQLPKRKINPGFIVQKVYDPVGKKLWKLNDTDLNESEEHEIDLLVAETISRLGDLPDIDESEEILVDQDNLKEEEGGSGAGDAPHHAILVKFDSLTGDAHRDKCLGKLLDAVQHICYIPEDKDAGDDKFLWPEAALPPVCALEKALHDASLASDSLKYNQKMRTLLFNLKNTELLARRLLNGKLEPPMILNMSPTELKEGLTSEETAKKEPDDADQMKDEGGENEDTEKNLTELTDEGKALKNTQQQS